MRLFTNEQHDQLVKNGSAEYSGQDHRPVVKWFTPDANATWLVTEIVDEETAFGLCDLGQGFPELGYISLEEIISFRGRLNLPIECDQSFTATHSLSVYAEAAQSNRCIIEDESKLHNAQERLKKSNKHKPPELK